MEEVAAAFAGRALMLSISSSNASLPDCVGFPVFVRLLLADFLVGSDHPTACAARWFLL